MRTTMAERRGRRFNPERIRSLRELSGLSLREFGERLGVSGAHIQGIEAGKHAPSVALLERMAEAFNVDVRSFFDGA